MMTDYGGGIKNDNKIDDVIYNILMIHPCLSSHTNRNYYYPPVDIIYKYS